jgi:hypothetical protein
MTTGFPETLAKHLIGTQSLDRARNLLWIVWFDEQPRPLVDHRLDGSTALPGNRWQTG